MLEQNKMGGLIEFLLNSTGLAGRNLSQPCRVQFSENWGERRLCKFTAAEAFRKRLCSRRDKTAIGLADAAGCQMSDIRKGSHPSTLRLFNFKP